MQTTYFSCAVARTWLLQSLLQCSLSDSLALESQFTLKLLESSSDSAVFLGLVTGSCSYQAKMWRKQHCVVVVLLMTKHLAIWKKPCDTQGHHRGWLHPKRFTWQPQQLWKSSFCEKLRDTRNSSSHKMINIILYLNNKPREIECKIGN